MIEIVAKYCNVYDSSFELLDIAKMYSKEIEYSEENIEAIFEELLFD